ncbi:MAG: DUF4340 domain-containing protein [Ruminococcus sp.]
MAKSKKKNNKNLLKIIIPALIVVLIAVALVVVFNLPDSEEEATLEYTEPAKITTDVDEDKLHQAEPATNEDGEVDQNGSGELMSYIPRNIKSISVENEKSKYEITSYTPVEKTTNEDGEEEESTQATEYTLVGYEDKELASGVPDAVANDAATLEFTKVVSTGDKDEKDFGFDSPRSTVDITYQDNTKVRITVGAVAPANSGVYVKFGTGKTIYLVAEDSVDSFLYSINDLISLEVTESASSGDDASPTKIELSGTHYKDKITVVPSDDETASTNYLITTPANYYGDDSGCSEIEAGIRGVLGKSVVYVNPGESQLEKYGLSQPYAEIKATYPDTTINLVASKANDKGYCYIMKKGGDVIYKILSESVKWSESSLDNLRSDFFVDNELTSLSKTEVKFDGKSYTFDINGKSSSADTVVKYNGKKVSTGSFQTAFDYMHSADFLRHEFTSDKISGSPALTIKFTYKSDTGRSADELKFYDMGKQKYYVTVNGEQVSYLYKSAVSKVEKLFTSVTKSSPKDDQN